MLYYMIAFYIMPYYIILYCIITTEGLIFIREIFISIIFDRILHAPQTEALLTESARVWGAECAHSRGTGTVALPWHGCGTDVSRSCHGRVTAVSRRVTDVAFSIPRAKSCTTSWPPPTD